MVRVFAYFLGFDGARVFKCPCFIKMLGVLLKVYYAHPMVAYGTRREQEELDIIRRKAPDAKIVNPARYSGDPSKTHEHMEFYHGLVDECDVVVYSDVGGEFMSAGVGEEVDYALEKGKPVYRIDHKTRKLVRVYGEAKHLSRAGTRLLYRTMKWSGLRGEDLNKIIRMKIAEFGGRLSEEDALLMVAADLGVNTRTFLNNALKEAPKQIKAEKPNYKDAETLKRLYEKEKLSTYKLAEKFEVSQATIQYWMGKHGISRRDRIEASIEASEEYPKKPFSCDPEEKAFMLGLRAGDIYAKRHGFNIRFNTTTTQKWMRKLMQNVYGRYGYYHETPMFNKDTNQYEFSSYSLTDGESFQFALEKPTEVPKDLSFYPFLAGYVISDGNWTISPVYKNLQFHFQLQTTDPELLKQVKERLEEEGFHPNFRPVSKAGEGGFGYTKDYYGVFLERKKEVVSLIEKLLPIYERRFGDEGDDYKVITWMRLILEVKDEKYWADVEDRVSALREKFDRETEECIKEAEEKYKTSHSGRDWFKERGYRKFNDKAK